jgi:hypothetical protein
MSRISKYLSSSIPTIMIAWLKQQEGKEKLDINLQKYDQ